MVGRSLSMSICYEGFAISAVPGTWTNQGFEEGKARAALEQLSETAWLRVVLEPMMTTRMIPSLSLTDM